jgi:hypothetical protein
MASACGQASPLSKFSGALEGDESYFEACWVRGKRGRGAGTVFINAAFYLFCKG